MTTSHHPSEGLKVAIIGAGITGITLALGLQLRGVEFTIYERATAFREIGAGVGFSPNAEAALAAVDPAALLAYKKVATPNGEDYFQWVDGYRRDDVLYKLHVGKDGFQGCKRSDFVDELTRLLPPDKIRLGKEAEAIIDCDDKDQQVEIHFRDGTTAKADFVIGCDGIHSRVRQILLGEANPASRATYTNKFCFRALVPMELARKSEAAHRSHTRFMFNGPDAHIITYPVGLNGELLNLLLVISDPDPWPQGPKRGHTAPGKKSEAIQAFASWHPVVRALVDFLPEELEKWAIFDMFENPAPYYSRGRVSVAGDAAHASGPHLGAGAGFGMEDALALCTLLKAADDQVKGLGDCSAQRETTRTRAQWCRDALKAYNDVRYERTQWLVGQTREACALFQWQDPDGHGKDEAQFAAGITRRFHTIWNYDTGDMVKQALDLFNNCRSD